MIPPARKKARWLVIVFFLLILYLLSLNVDRSEDIDIDAILRVLDQPVGATDMTWETEGYRKSTRPI